MHLTQYAIVCGAASYGFYWTIIVRIYVSEVIIKAVLCIVGAEMVGRNGPPANKYVNCGLIGYLYTTRYGWNINAFFIRSDANPFGAGNLN